MSSIFHAPTLEADPTAQAETFDSFAVADAYVVPAKPAHEVRTLPEPPEIWDLVPEATEGASAKPVREVRTLHEPPEIWDLVPEAPKRFNRSSALLVRLTSFNPLILALIVVIGGGAAVFGYMNWGNWSGIIRAASDLFEEPGGKTNSSLRATVPERRPTSSPSSEQPRPAASPIVLSTKRTTVAVAATEPKYPVAETPAAVIPTAEQVAAPAVVTAKASIAKPRRPSLTTSEPALARVPNNERPHPSTKRAETSDDGQRASVTATRHAEEKTQSVPVNPPKATATPKGKVIQWP